MKKLTHIITLAFIALAFSSCDKKAKHSTADQEQQKATAQAMAEANRQIGMPNINNFQQRKTMKLIYELTDNENLICYAYLHSEMTGKLIYIGECIGYGIPFSAQYTNPEKIVANNKSSQSSIFGKLPQADPNGLFMPTSSSATWLMMIDPETKKPRPVYFEPKIVVSPFKLEVSSD